MATHARQCHKDGIEQDKHIMLKLDSQVIFALDPLNSGAQVERTKDTVNEEPGGRAKYLAFQLGCSNWGG